ncbi:Uncharacterised protein [Vibrio cholerae]|nr:Uncharacterised protein [Vibrio cholerae]
MHARIAQQLDDFIRYGSQIFANYAALVTVRFKRQNR